MSTILVTGASGFVGSHMLPALLDAGHSVRALVRGDDSARQVRARLSVDQRGRLTFATGDVTDPSTLGPAVAGADAVLHLVAIPRDWSGGRDLDRVNSRGTVSVVRAMEQEGVARLVHQGVLWSVDRGGGTPSRYLRSKARAEAAVRQSSLRWTIMRPSLLWGERDGFFNVLATLVRLSPGITPRPATSVRFQPLAVSDLARIVTTCLATEDTVGQTYDLGGPDRWTYREMLAEVLRGMGKRRLVVPIPVALLGVMARSCELLHVPFPVASDQVQLLAFDNTTDLDSVQRAFGFEPIAMAGNLGYLRRRLSDQEPHAA